MTPSTVRAARESLLAVALAAAACVGDEPAAQDDAGVVPEATARDERPAGIPRRAVTLLLPSARVDGLVPVEAEIFATASPIDQAKQVLGLLLAAPPGEGLVAPLPRGTSLRAVFIDARGTAFVSLSREAAQASGSAGEILAVHSLVGSLSRSVPQVKRVQVLVEGQEVETLAGHLDLRRPLTLDARLVLEQ